MIKSTVFKEFDSFRDTGRSKTTIEIQNASTATTFIDDLNQNFEKSQIEEEASVSTNKREIQLEMKMRLIAQISNDQINQSDRQLFSI